MTEQERKDKRFTARQPLLVSCPSWGEFVQLYGADVSQGGMFIVTPDPPPILTTIEVQLALPEGHHISLSGRVVHVISAEQAKLEGREAGVGIEFQDLDAERKLQIQQLIDFASTAGQDPNASFSRHLLEVSPSQRPNRIFDSLPPPDPGHGASAASPVHAPPPPPRVSVRPSPEPAPRSRVSSVPSSVPAEDPPAKRISSKPGRTSDPALDDTGEHAFSSRETGDSVRLSSGTRGSDPQKLKLGMTHLSYKRFAQAVRTFEMLLEVEPGDREAKKWLLIAHARQALAKNNEEAAAKAYQQLLEVDEANHEARKFVRSFHVDRRLRSLPFARYFVKQKPEPKKKSPSRH